MSTLQIIVVVMILITVAKLVVTLSSSRIKYQTAQNFHLIATIVLLLLSFLLITKDLNIW